MKRVSIFGVTGSVGSQAAQIVAADPENFTVDVLTAGGNVEGLVDTAKTLNATHCVIADEAKEGQLADLVAINRTHPSLCSLRDDQLLDGLCFAAPDGIVTDLWSAGRHQVQGGRHIARDAILGNYRAAMAELLADL